MNQFEFEQFAKELYDFFRDNKKPELDEIDRWMPDIEQIPGSALAWILTEIKETKNTLPRNLPRLLNDCWKKYLNEHPEIIAKESEIPDYNCPECHGLGFLAVKAYDNKLNRNYERICACASCGAGSKVFGKVLLEGGKMHDKLDSGAWIPTGNYCPPIAKMTIEQIKAKGWQHIPGPNPYEKIAEIDSRDVSELVNDINQKSREQQSELAFSNPKQKHEFSESNADEGLTIEAAENVSDPAQNFDMVPHEPENIDNNPFL
jgi:hypothetical protein